VVKAEVPVPTNTCAAGTLVNPVPPYQTGVIPVSTVGLVTEVVVLVELPPSNAPAVNEAKEDPAPRGTHVVPLYCQP